MSASTRQCRPSQTGSGRRPCFLASRTRDSGATGNGGRMLACGTAREAPRRQEPNGSFTPHGEGTLALAEPTINGRGNDQRRPPAVWLRHRAKRGRTSTELCRGETRACRRREVDPVTGQANRRRKRPPPPQVLASAFRARGRAIRGPRAGPKSEDRARYGGCWTGSAPGIISGVRSSAAQLPRTRAGVTRNRRRRASRVS